MNIPLLVEPINKISLHNGFCNFLFFAQRPTVGSTSTFFLHFFAFIRIIASIPITFFDWILTLFRRMSSMLHLRVFCLGFLAFIVTFWGFSVIFRFEIEVIKLPTPLVVETRHFFFQVFTHYFFLFVQKQNIIQYLLFK